MTETHVVSGLIKKRAELAGRIEHLQDVLRQAIMDLDNIDAAIFIFDPSIELAAIQARPVPPRHHAFRGELSRIVLGMLREATEPVATDKIAAKVMEGRGLDPANQRLARTIMKRTGACLRDHRVRGVVRAHRGPGPYILWELVR